MANAQLMEEELQQSVVLSEEDAEFEEDVADDVAMVDTGSSIPSGGTTESVFHEEQASDARQGSHDEEDDEVGPIAPDQVASQDGQRGDLEGVPADDEDDDQEDHLEDDESSSQEGSVHDDDEVSDVDAEGEDDDEEDVVIQPPGQVDPNGLLIAEDDEEAEENVADGEEEDDDEGVGAVKIKPGETDDEESESEADVSSASGATSGSDSDDRGSAVEWESGAENDDDDERDEDSEAPDPNACIFCKKVEETHPAEASEAYLACKGCGEHAHQQCARDANALDDQNGASNWKCPDCVDYEEEDAEADSETELTDQKMDGESNVDVEVDAEMDMNSDAEDGDLSPTSIATRASAPKLARDLLPAQRGANKPDSHSVFNQLVLNEDPMDGSRVLRKRKTSSAEPEELMQLRKRTRNTSLGSVKADAAQEQVNGAAEPPSVRPRSSRSLRLKLSSPVPQCSVVKKSRTSHLMKMRVDAAALQRILSKKPKSSRNRAGRAVASRPSRPAAGRGGTYTAAAATAVAEPPATVPFFASSYSQPFYSFYDKETDELKGKPYGGILTEEQADTTKTLPTKEDRRRFDEAKQKAEEEWRNRLLAVQAEADVPLKKSKKTSGPASQIECIEFGGWEIDTWYAAPYPEEYSRNRVLFICEFCLKYMNSDYVAWRHKLKCPAKHPPGDEIYRHGSIAFFEVDGRKNPVYCQNLCLLAKLFLGSKTLYYDVEPFLFYVLCEYDDLGYHFVGYFSKEKRASSQNNVSCILTLPIHQRKGYGHLLIDFSYLLTRVEQKTGSPEKPLSDMGLVSYRNYWRLVLCKYLINRVPEDKLRKKGTSLRQISDDLGMTPDDVIAALEALRFLVRDPVTQVYAFRVDLLYCHREVAKWEGKKYVKLSPQVLTWTPYVMGRSNATNFELGPALNAIAPREEDEDTKTVHVLADSGITNGNFAAAKEMVQNAALQITPAVLESTEPNDNAAADDKQSPKVNGVDKENAEVHPPTQDDAMAPAEGVDDAPEEADNWIQQYDNIPVSRFQVFPPINARRPGVSRISSSIARPAALPRTLSSTVRTPARPKARPQARRSTGGASSRKAAPKKNSTVKRKSGGTGRGPGRWPKGTKKSDYGNADSGPGLPPGWEEERKAVLKRSGMSENDIKETVQVETVKAQVDAANRKRGKQIETVFPGFEVRGDLIGEGSAQASSASGSNSKTAGEDEDAEGDPDVAMGEDGNAAAEGVEE
ncbi:Uu.00g124610.m01.CDS01 [Anthostomella pinea]|uniref:Histone acetyltransferase n=1 Tax=Anthostomella pinea TaxID=933095 RepID=A0AAI8VHM9_9PEZI|nr:Uu.00g124610.m01.CDS01 [Anthostomella pinea]